MAPQRRGRFNYYGAIGPNPSYDGAFMFCRIAFNNASNGDGGGWFVDYPRADTNLSFRFSELTAATVSRDIAGNFNHAVYRLTDAEIDHCPFIMMTEPGGTYSRRPTPRRSGAAASTTTAPSARIPPMTARSCSAGSRSTMHRTATAAGGSSTIRAPTRT